MARVVVLFLPALLLVAGCGSAPPTPVGSELPRIGGAARLVERSDQRADRMQIRVALPGGVRDLQLHADCRSRGTGRLAVDVSGLGGGTFECHRRSGGGLVGLDGENTSMASGGVRTVTVTASPGVTWSVAVDAR